MKLQIIVILLVTVGIAAGIAQLGDDHVTITVTSEGKTKITQALFPKTFVSTVDVHIISEKISNLLATDEKNILLGTTQEQNLLKIATLGASSVDLKYNADILTYKSGVFNLKYSSELESKVNLPPLSKLVSLNTIPIEISDKEYFLPPGDISLSYTIRPVTSKEFFVQVEETKHKVETISAAKIEEFSGNSDEIQFITKDKTVILTIIPTALMPNPNEVLLNGETTDFSQFHQNSTHSWIRVDPHEKGLVRIINEKGEGGGCLIATASYGSELAPQVQLLREIRDQQLMKTESGVSFMAGFNELYYSFSPTIADLERENPAFKELVKIVITPMLSSLFIMTFAESENEILGLGTSVILINIGMYFVLPFVIFYYFMSIMRTYRLKKSNWHIISSNSAYSVVKKSLFGIIALLVLSVSVSSAFEPAYAEDEDPIKTVLDITYQNILESRADIDEIPDNADTFFTAGEEKYLEALSALEAGDTVAAKENALIAMALFEDSAAEIGALQAQASTQFPPGLGSGIGSASDTGISSGQGLGVGGIPPGIFEQTVASSIFEVQEEITDIDEEIEGLRELIESNNLGVNFEEYDKSINLAKEVLANGDIPNAQAKLDLANEIKNDLYEQMNTAVVEKQEERVQEFVENSIKDIEETLEKGDNLGLTQNAIDELQDTLNVLKTGETEDVFEKTSEDSKFVKEIEDNTELTKQFEAAPGNSENAPGQSNEETAPGNSENAPGQSNEETAPGNSENAPGQNKEESPSSPTLIDLDTVPEQNDDGPGNSENAPGQNQGNQGFDGPGNSENAPGQNQGNQGFGDSGFDDGGIGDSGFGASGIGDSIDDKPDDFFEISFEESVVSNFESNFDGTKKGNNGKGKAGSTESKTEETTTVQSNSNGGGGGSVVNTIITSAIDDSSSTIEDTTLIIPVLDNDLVANGKTLEIIRAGTSDFGGAVSHDGISITYTPLLGFTGIDTIVYEISDGTTTDTATVTVTVYVAGTCVNEAPVIGSGASIGNNGSIGDCTVIGTNFDVGNNHSIGLRVSIGDGVEFKNNLTIGDGAVIGDRVCGKNNISIAAGEVVPNNFVYPGASCDTTPLVANDDSSSTTKDTAVTISVLDNDSGDTLEITSVQNPADGYYDADKDEFLMGGSIVIDGTDVTYTPVLGFIGIDTFVYMVSDGIDTKTATVTVTVRTVDANAGADQTASEGDIVTLDGSGSSGEGTLFYDWIQTFGSGIVVLSSSTAVNPTFEAPGSSSTQTFGFELMVTDDNGSGTDTVTITVGDIGADVTICHKPGTSAEQTKSVPTSALDGHLGHGDTLRACGEIPIVPDAGPDQSVTELTTVTLDGSSSSGDGTLTYDWIQTFGTPATIVLSSSTAVSPTFTAPDVVSGSQTYTFELTVTDDVGPATDSVDIVVSDAAADAPPTANAGPDRTVGIGAGNAGTLDGSGSTDSEGVLTYSWVRDSDSPYNGGPDLVLSSSTVESPTAHGASNGADGRTYKYVLTVTDTEGQTHSDSVLITVNSGNTAPTANAGTDQSVTELTTVTLDGSGSTDPNGTISAYSWIQTFGTPSSIVLSSSTAVNPTFTAPDVGSSGELYKFALTVTDDVGATSSADEVEITVNDLGPLAANAGTGSTINEGELGVTLDGSASTGESTRTYAWTQTSGPQTISITNPTQAVATFDTPTMTSNEDYVFTLTVTDSRGSVTDTVSITINNVITPRVANAGPDATYSKNSDESLDGSGSSGEGTLTYSWTQLTSFPVTFVDPNPAMSPTFRTYNPGNGVTDEAIFQLTVTDAIGSSTDTVTISIVK